MEEALSVLERSGDLLQNGGDDDAYERNLQRLSNVLKATACDEAFRETLMSNPSYFDSLMDTQLRALLTMDKNSTNEKHFIRTYRGLVLLARNLVVSSQGHLDIPLLLLDIQQFEATFDEKTPLYKESMTALLELLSNYACKHETEFSCNMILVNDTFKGPILQLIFADECLERPFTLFILKCLLDGQSQSDLLSKELLTAIIAHGVEKFNPESAESNLLALLEKVVICANFRTWLEEQLHEDIIPDILRLCQVVVTSKEDWDNRECTIILYWSFSLLQTWTEEVHASFEAKNKFALAALHPKVLPLLDMIAELSKFHTAQAFLQHYNALEVLIPLLRVVHENTSSANVAKKAEPDDAIKFPAVKSFIIEIIAFMCFESFQTQEKVRELHGLELILSNCVIDDDNPYIRERSILCLRFVLQNNQQNQNFVAQLEAKEVVHDEALQEVGYEVEINAGKVELKKRTQ